jgi:hypothetical protein
MHLDSFNCLFLHFSRDILTFLDEVERCCETTSESTKTQFQAVKNTRQSNELKFTAVARFVNLSALSRCKWYIYNDDSIYVHVIK